MDMVDGWQEPVIPRCIMPYGVVIGMLNYAGDADDAGKAVSD